MAEEKIYKVEIARPAMIRYHELVLPYIYEHFSFNRAIEIDEGVIAKVETLSKKPKRGAREKYLEQAGQDFRFILHQETKHFELKIIYYVDENESRVYVTDIFPTRMNPDSMASDQ